MKLVATSDFRNTHTDKIDVGDDKIADSHVHKGARFSIGGDVPLEKLSGADKRLVAELNAAGRIVYADQTEKVKAIDAEVAAETKKVKAAQPADAKK